MNPRLMIALVLGLVCFIGLVHIQHAKAQSPNPTYLREMPSEQRILRDVKGADPIDTAARQSGAFAQLSTIIYDLALVDHRDRNHVLPDERKIADYYDAASERTWEQVTTAVGRDRPRLAKLNGYRTDPNFKAELLEQLFSPNFRALCAKADKIFAERHKEYVENPQPPPAQQTPARQQPVAGNDPAANDRGTVAMRRCVAAGRDPLQCLSEVFSEGLKTMAGGDAGMGSAYGETLPPSLRLTGRYGDGHLSLSFTEDTVWITCERSSYQASYTVAMRNGLVAVNTTPGREGAALGNQPIPFALQDGKLVAAGIAKVTSSAPVPGQSTAATKTARRYISEEEAKNPSPWEHPMRDTGGNPYVDEPISSGTGGMHTTKTSMCKLGAELPLGSTGPSRATQGVDKLVGSKTTAEMFGGAPWEQRSAQDKAWPAPGLRLHGTFAGNSGLNLEFHEDSVMVGCGQVMSARKYLIRSEGTQAFINIDNDANPIMFALGPNLSLAGSGSFRVNGHAFVGNQRQNGPMFETASATCAMGTLTPQQ